MEGVEMSVKNQLNWAFLLEKKDFFNQLFSTHYSFLNYELTRFKSLLNLGNESYQIDSGAIRINTSFGLIFNQNISWTENIRHCFRKEKVLIYTGGGKDEYSNNVNFDSLPISLSNELQFLEQQDISDLIQGGLDSEFQISEIIEYYFQIFTKVKFESDFCFNVMNKNEVIWIANYSFYLDVLNLVETSIQNFNIIKFYEYLNTLDCINQDTNYKLVQIVSENGIFMNDKDVKVISDKTFFTQGYYIDILNPNKNVVRTTADVIYNFQVGEFEAINDFNFKGHIVKKGKRKLFAF